MTERSHIVVGYHGGPTCDDALAFGQRWCRASGDAMLVVTVHPGQAALGIARVDAEWVAYEREQADKLLDEARERVADDIDVDFRRIDAGSAAHGLHDLAENVGGNLVVLGARSGRGLRRTYPGSTAMRLFQGAALPICVVPWGYAASAENRLDSVAVAFVDTPDGRVAVQHAAEMATHLSAGLRVVSVVPDTRVVPGLTEPRMYETGQREVYRASLQEVVADLGTDLEVTPDLLDGPVVDALTELSLDDADVLVLGSRGYGPVRRVLLGGVSFRVVRHARLPVIVVPRGDT